MGRLTMTSHSSLAMQVLDRMMDTGLSTERLVLLKAEARLSLVQALALFSRLCLMQQIQRT